MLTTELGASLLDDVDPATVVGLNQQLNTVACHGAPIETAGKFRQPLLSRIRPHGGEPATNGEHECGFVMFRHAIIIVCRGSSLMSRG